MSKTLPIFALLSLGSVTIAQGSEIRGHYLESRTCQVYTGPCFANGETGLAGKNAVMAWSITDGEQEGVSLSGLKVVVALGSSDTLGFGGLADGKKMRSVILVDQTATREQHAALVKFAKQHAGRACQQVTRVASAPIEMSLNESTLKAKLNVGKQITLETRKAGKADCICSNETAYYPPLAKVENFVPGVTTVGEVNARGLGTRWSSPGDRSAYMATFVY